MKKLMIAAAIVCAAALSQAATANWSIEGMDNVSGTVYTFCTKGDNAVKYADFVAALEACTTAEAFNTEFANWSSKAITSLGGTVDKASTFAKTGVDLKTAGIPEETKTTKLFSVILSDETMTADSTWYITETSNSVNTPAYNTQSLAGFGVTSGVTAHTFTAPAPEPTSGLLLLLGVAGLALKRRRA